MPTNIHFSKRALQNKPELCSNQCGAYIYKFMGEWYNAEISKKDSLHKDTCSVLNTTWMIAGSMNWYPDYAFLNDAENLIKDVRTLHEKCAFLTINALFEQIMKLDKIAEQLELSIKARKIKNEEFRQQWKEVKAWKKAEKERRRKKNNNNNV